MNGTEFGLGGGGSLGPVLVVDDDQAGSDLLREVLGRAGIPTVGLSRGAEVLDEVRRERPVLVVLEVSLPDVNGYEVCRALRSEFGEDLPVILASGTRTDALDRTAGLMIGADDYIVKPFDADELVARVRRLVARSREATVPPARRHDLTPRELEILGLLAGGKRVPDIARTLTISPKTVSNHMQRLFVKLRVHSQSQAVALAFQQGLVSERNFQSRTNGPLAEPELEELPAISTIGRSPRR
jgi:DNA-binding NarL/FixJ family response regulator